MPLPPAFCPFGPPLAAVDPFPTGRVVQMDFDENPPTSSMVFDVIMGASGWIIARNERIGIVAFQNIQNYCQRTSIRDYTAPRK